MSRRKILTLCMVTSKDGVLLGMKKRGFGAGRWNGFGGKVEPGETIEEAAVREVQEEVSVTPTIMSKIGILEFSFVSDPMVLEVHVYRVTDFRGEPTESEEMQPQWFSWDQMPFSQMWADDEYWFPYIKEGKKFKGSFLFDAPATKDHAGRIIEKNLTEVSDDSV
jgi:8-oxo-dGTP diphosphatase / 2-hydroxy-dATP diphosphatase